MTKEQQAVSSAQEQPITLLPIEYYTLEVYSVSQVDIEGKDPFISIVGECNRARVTFTCSLLAYEKMGIESKLPLGTQNVTAKVAGSYVPDDGGKYGYKDRNGEIVEYEKTGKYRLANVDMVIGQNDSILELFQLTMGHPWDPATASETDREVFLRLIGK